MFANSYNTYMKKYSFKLLNNPVAKTILIGVFDLNTKELLDCSVGYTYQDIQKALTKKLKNLLYVTAQTKKKEVRNSSTSIKPIYIQSHHLSVLYHS